jgi:hypothetical protein
MAQNKKQHFVPQFLLRHFSFNENRKQIGVYNIHTGFNKADCPLDSQAQEKYLYDNDSSVENLLCTVENKAAPIISQILKNGVVPKVKTIDFSWLLMFTIDQAFRTPVQAEQLNQSLNETAKMLMKFEEKFDNVDIENLKFRYERPAANSLGFSSEGLYRVADLSLKLLINKTNKPFILSDNPVARYNQFLEKLEHSGHQTVLLAKGLQLFFPISPTIMLLYYDKWAYSIKEEHPVVNISNPYDVDKLNSLQLINCRNTVYYSNNIDKDYLADNFEKIKIIRDIPDPITQMQAFIYQGKCYGGMQPIGGNKGIKLNLSFIKPTKKAQIFKQVGTLIPFRKEEWRGEIKKTDVPLDVVKRIFEVHPPTFIE